MNNFRRESLPFVSVIIPVYNDTERLKICLNALEHQTYPSERYEVVVVDNGSDEDIEPVVRRFSHARLAREDRLGAYAARNKGISVASGEILAFTDSDCIPDSDWIQTGVGAFRSIPGVGLVGGKVTVFPRDPKHLTAVELYESTRTFPQKKNVEKNKFSPTANLFTYRNVFDRVGLFNDCLKSCGDAEWGHRVYSAGYKQVYADNAQVKHPARRTFREAAKKRIRLAGGHHQLKRARGQPNFQLMANIINTYSSPMSQITHYWSNKSLQSNKNRVRFIVIECFLYLVRLGETIRLKCGGSPTRG